MAWIEPLDLETWLIQVFAGDKSYFSAIAIFAVLTLCGYFRLNGINAGFMIFVLVLMFSGYIPASLMIFIAIFGGLILGIVLKRINTN